MPTSLEGDLQRGPLHCEKTKSVRASTIQPALSLLFEKKITDQACAIRNMGRGRNPVRFSTVGFLVRQTVILKSITEVD